MKKIILFFLLSFPAYLMAQTSCNITINGNPKVVDSVCISIIDDVVIYGNPSVGSGDSTYLWTIKEGNTGQFQQATNLDSVYFTPYPAGTYTVVFHYTDNNIPATVTDTIVIIVKPLPTLKGSSTDKYICKGSSTQLWVNSNANKIIWYTESVGGLPKYIGTPVTVSPTFTTTYVLVLEDTIINHCPRTKYVKITVIDLGAIATVDEDTICKGDTSRLKAIAVDSVPGGNTSYKWSPSTNMSNQNVADPEVWPKTNTTYTVTVTDISSGCTATASVLVTVNPQQAPVIHSDTTICNGGTAILTVTPSGKLYKWNYGQSTASITVSPGSTTTYIVTMTDAGCTDADTAIVTVAPVVHAEAGIHSFICYGDSTGLGGSPTGWGGVGSLAYTWTPSAGLNNNTLANPTASPTTHTIYTVTVRDSIGCTATDTVSVSVNPQIVIDPGNFPPVCVGGCKKLGGTPTATGGSGGLLYSWTSVPSGFFSNSPNPTACPTVVTTYKVVVTDSKGCKDSATVTLTIDTAIARASCNPDSICKGGSALLTATGGVRFKWSTSPNDTLANNTVSPTVNTTYKVTVTTVNGCTSTAQVTVYIKVVTSAISANPPSICSGGSSILTASGGGTYYWSTGVSTASITVTPAITTSYCVTVTKNGCTDSTCITVIVGKPATSATANPSVICDRDSTLLTATGGGTYYWSTGESDNPIWVSPNTTTKYYVTVTNGCTALDSVTVTVIPKPIVILTSSDPDNKFCFGDPVIFTATGATTYTFYDGIPPGGTIIQGPGAVNTYTSSSITNGMSIYVIGSVTGACPDTTLAITNTVYPTPTVTITSTPPDSCTKCNGSMEAFPSGGTFGYAYEWNSSPIQYTKIASALCAGTYAVTVSDANLCTATAVATISDPGAPPITLAVNPNDTICDGDCVTFTASTTSLSTMTYDFYINGGLPVQSGASNTFGPICTLVNGDVVSVKGTDTAGCAGVALINMVVSPMPMALNLVGGGTICADDSLQIGLNGSQTGINYILSINSTPVTSKMGNNAAISFGYFNTAGMYTVTGTDTSTACPKNMLDTAYIIINPIPNAIVGPPKAICIGDSTTIGGTPPVVDHIYNWTPALGLSSTTVSQPWAKPAVTTKYFLTETDTITGCDKTDSVLVTVNPLPAANVGPPKTICFGDTTTIGAADVPTSRYKWTPATGLSSDTVSNPNAYPTATTTYHLTETDTITLCYKIDSVVVTVNPIPNAYVGPSDTICFGDSIQIGGAPVLGNTYNWNPPIGLSSSTVSNPKASPAQTTTYHLTEIITATGCDKTDSITITVDSLPDANTGPNKAICFGDTVQIGAADVPTSRFKWTPPIGLSNDSISNPLAYPTGTTVYTLTETDTITHCFKSNTVTVTVNPLPNAFTGPDTSICFGDFVTIGGAAVSGNTYSWTQPAGLSSTTASNPSASPATSRYYYLTETVTGTLCVKTDSVYITVYPLPAAEAGNPQVICFGDSTTPLGAAAVAGNTYKWSPVAGLSNPNISDPTASPAITTKYFLTVTLTATGCDNIDSVIVTVNPLPAANTGPDKPLCIGDTTTIGATAVSGNTYIWTPALGLSSTTVANPDAYPTVTTKYYLTETNTTTGCSNRDSVIITVNPIPAANAGADQEICFGDSIQIGAAPVSGNTYSWIPTTGLSSATVSNPMAFPATTTVYTLTETITGTGCTASNSVTVTVDALPIADAGADRKILQGNSTVIGATAIAGNTYSWSSIPVGFTSTVSNPTVSPKVKTTYIVTVTDVTTGCLNYDTVVVSVYNIDIYNGFSPNGDGINDYWEITVLGYYTENTVTVMNRWGDVVWKCDNYDNNVKGPRFEGKNMDGNLLPDGTYYYIVKYEDSEKRGWVFIKR